MNGWIGVDLEGTLATYNPFQSLDNLGEPVPKMVERVKRWLSEGYEVKIMTARASQQNPNRLRDLMLILDWQKKYFDFILPTTSERDMQMVELWDDRCVQVIPNEGIPVTDALRQKEVFNKMQSLPETPIIDFEHIPTNNTQPSIPVQKKWDFRTTGTFNRKVVKATPIKQQLRITIPKDIIASYDLTVEHKIYLTAIPTKGCIELRMTQDDLPVTEYDYMRKLSPIGIGLLCFYIPRSLRRKIDDGHLESVWLVSPQNALNPEGHVVLEMYPT